MRTFHWIVVYVRRMDWDLHLSKEFRETQLKSLASVTVHTILTRELNRNKKR